MILNLGIAEYDYPEHGQFGGKLLVCGGGRTVWEDMEPFLPQIRGEGMDIMAVNDVGCHIPFPIRHWYSNDAEHMPYWMGIRKMRYRLARRFMKHTFRHKKDQGCIVWPWPGHGTSSLNAVYTALALGYQEIVLCGVPLDDRGHYFDPPWVSTNFTAQVREKDGELKYWSNAARDVFEDKVRSMSGRTRTLLGAPC